VHALFLQVIRELFFERPVRQTLFAFTKMISFIPLEIYWLNLA